MVDRPNQEAIERLEKIAKQSKRSTVQLPQAFARDGQSKVADPVLAMLLRRNGLLVKTYLTVAMVSTKDPHTTTKPATELAAALGLPQPETAGARRVNAALKQLENLDLVRREHRRGRVPITHVLDARGSGKPWGEVSLGNPWITLPITLWQRGWFVALSPRAITLIVVLKELTHGRPGQKAWVDGIRKRQYGLSDDTWTRATTELVSAGLLDIERDTYQSQGEPRQRNVYRLRLDLLSLLDPGDPVPDTDSEALPF
ncbi:hypothetical protein [Luteipulveratus flavus]|uniref:Uncharacterized protein n=1 Tax=Luteipulveratus flavus TaxID=3031728 RepID=A0ABT6CC48_9MICO|nr:hypothetical protein [Luteipulveratus sp. YIM 133296]MDF8266461.1 hypothetical protein [Luteipulveratus sp. YIM 133296]